MNNQDPPICSMDAQVLIKNKGKISFGYGCIIHPKAKIIAEGDCSIIIGEYNIIEENVIIRAIPKFNPQINLNETITVFIGNYNIFKVGVELENTNIQNHNLFDFRCKLDECYVESKSIITPGVKIPKRTMIKSGSIVLDNQIIVTNNNFNETENVLKVKEMYNLLSVLLSKSKTYIVN